MATVFDVARYILTRLDEDGKLPVTTWKLQKLVYYSQAWSLVWDDAPLFEAPIQAWANGPVCPVLYRHTKASLRYSAAAEIDGNPRSLTETQRETVDEVIKHYGRHAPQYLSELTHSELPWQEAREGLSATERGNRAIKLDTMAQYYGGL